MCNLFSKTPPVEAMRRLFAVDPTGETLGNHPPLPAIYPRQEAAAVRVGGAARASCWLCTEVS